MAETKISLSGWKAAVVVVILIGLVGARLTTLRDMKDDKVLMRKIRTELMSDYFPDQVERLKDALVAGDAGKAKSAITTRAEIESVKASYPLLRFSSPKDVVIEVTYSLKDASGAKETRTKYYLFKHSVIGNHWSFQHETTSSRYYLNFR